LVIGAGGAARALVYGLKRERAAITISNRGLERGEALARTFACDFVPLSELQRSERSADFDIIVQCTPIGLMGKEDSDLIPDSLFRPGAVVMDTVYRPLWTPFLRKARAAGCLPVSGVEMLLHQGIAQLEWWLGERMQPEVVQPIMRTALTKVLTDE
jgi:shikimate dehydrogenase